MKTFMPGKAMRLGDVPSGGVVGSFVDGRYARFLRTASETPQGAAVVSLGPFCDEDYAAHVQGPTSYFWEADRHVFYEDGTAIAPKFESELDPASNRHMEIGTIVMTRSGQTCIYCRSWRGGRALIDLSDGEMVGEDRAILLYGHYVLTALDALQKRQIVFDSSKQVMPALTAA